jgi:hypothetical protein
MILGEHENAVTPEEREACQNKIVLAFREATEVITRLAEIYDPAYDDKIGRLLHYFKNLSRSRTTVNTLLNTPRSKPVEFVTEASSF